MLALEIKDFRPEELLEIVFLAPRSGNEETRSNSESLSEELVGAHASSRNIFQHRLHKYIEIRELT